MHQRTPLRAAFSTDHGKTWPRRIDLATGKNGYGYPVAIQTRDGTIQVIYTSDGRSVINRAVFRE